MTMSGSSKVRVGPSLTALSGLDAFLSSRLEADLGKTGCFSFRLAD